MNWFLAINYFFHLLATVVLLGSLAGVVGFALPALRRGDLSQNRWIDLQKRLIPWTNGSLVLLLLSGFYQMTADPNYGGFLVLDNLWSWMMLLKHIAYAGMIVITFYLQFSVYPEIDRLKVLAQKRPELVAEEKELLLGREIALLRINVICAILVVLFTAIMTAV